MLKKLFLLVLILNSGSLSRAEDMDKPIPLVGRYLVEVKEDVVLPGPRMEGAPLEAFFHEGEVQPLTGLNFPFENQTRCTVSTLYTATHYQRKNGDKPAANLGLKAGQAFVLNELTYWADGYDGLHKQLEIRTVTFTASLTPMYEVDGVRWKAGQGELKSVFCEAAPGTHLFKKDLQTTLGSRFRIHKIE